MNELSIFLGKLIGMIMIYLLIKAEYFIGDLLYLIGHYFQRNNNYSKESYSEIAEIKKKIDKAIQVLVG